MSDARSFQVGPSPRLDVRIERGSIVLVSGDEGSIGVELSGPGADQVRVDASPTSVTVQTTARMLRGGAPVDAHLTVPPDVRTSLALATGRIDVRTTIAELQASAASGDVQVTAVTERASVKTASGDVRVDALRGDGSLTSGSGDLRLGRIEGHARATTASGDIEIGALAGELTCKTASGDVTVRRFDEGRLDFRTVSGDTTVAIPPGRKVSYDVHAVSGSLRLPDAPAAPTGPAEGTKPEVHIEGRSVSGDTHLQHAPPEA